MNSRKHILVVDDEVAILNSLALSLEKTYRVSTAASGSEALSALKACMDRHESVDLLITDIMLTDMNGIQLIDHIREMGEWMPTLAISGFGTKDIIIQLLQRGVQDYLDKPFEPEDLVKRVDRILGAASVKAVPAVPWRIQAVAAGVEVLLADDLLDSHGNAFRCDMQALSVQAPAAVVFRCAGLTHLAYAPLMVLVAFARTMRSRSSGARLLITGATGNLRSLLRVAGMDALYQLED